MTEIICIVFQKKTLNLEISLDVIIEWSEQTDG